MGNKNGISFVLKLCITGGIMKNTIVEVFFEVDKGIDFRKKFPLKKWKREKNAEDVTELNVLKKLLNYWPAQRKIESQIKKNAKYRDFSSWR